MPGKNEPVPADVEDRDKLAVSATISSVRIAPLPSPEELEKYGQILPDLPERIVKMAEEQAMHRQGLEKAVVHTDNIARMCGLCFGFVVCIVSLAIVAFALYLGRVDVALTTFLVTATGTVVAFITGRPRNPKNQK